MLASATKLVECFFMPVTLEDDEYDIVNTYALVGLAVHDTQNVEGILKGSLVLVFKDSQGQPLADLTDPKTQKQTLGTFISMLKKKMDLNPQFEEILTAYLDHRNLLIHRLSDNKIYRFNDALGRKNIRAFLNLFWNERDVVAKTLVGFMMLWADPEKYADLSKVRVRHPEGSWLGDAERIFAPHATSLIRKKLS